MNEVDEYLTAALAANRRAAWRMARDRIEAGSSFAEVVTDLLVPAQSEIGERWYRGEATVSDEHLVTGITESVLERVGGVALPSDTNGQVVVCCAETELHTLPSRMFADLLRSRGWAVSYLGTSNPPGQIAAFLERIRPVALIVSCTVPTHFVGAAHLATMGHRSGVPVLIGGRALEGRDRLSPRLGADAEAADLDAAHLLLQAWSDETRIDLSIPAPSPEALRLCAAADEIAVQTFDRLARTWDRISEFDDNQIDRGQEMAANLARVVSASVLVGEPGLLKDHLAWLAALLSFQGITEDALVAVLTAMVAEMRDRFPGATDVLTSGATDFPLLAG